ncbi:glycosyltransferase family 4 protein [Halosimplex halophilum]|uniref:glycosyltransferase family 4 protein n=1 Tax=Halosimplex halophilum TaxID=2559572 RepID=UPI00107F9825|nr:glycosyltransferase family 1 protein [Halosimplex halophilum]
MHVGVDARTFSFPEPGGDISYGMHFARRLADRSTAVTLFGHGNVADRFPGFELESAGYLVDSQAFGLVWEQTLLPRLGDRRDIDVLFCPNSYCPLRSCSFPAAIAVQDIPSYHGFKRGAYARFRKRMLPRVTDRAETVITVSEFTKAELNEYVGVPTEKIAVVPNGVDDIFYREETPSVDLDLPEEYVLYVGAMSDRKNVAGLVEAFDELKRETDLPHELVLIGPSQNPTYGSVTPESAAAADDIHRPGYVSVEELKYAYDAASLFAFPSFHESFGIPPVEAMACGTPVVASDAGALPEVLGDAAHTVDPEDPSDIADGMATVLGDADYAARLRRRGRERAARYTWEAATDRLLTVLSETAE